MSVAKPPRSRPKTARALRRMIRKTTEAQIAPTSSGDAGTDGADKASVAEYIADMAAELAWLAGSSKLDTLAYLLNMARLEAESHMKWRL